MNTLSVEFNQEIFNLTDPKKSFLSPNNKKNLIKLTTGIKKKKKLFLVTGERNSGKTTLVQRAISELDTKTLLINVDQESLSFEELIDFTGNLLKDGFSLETSLEKKSILLRALVKTEDIKHIIFLINQSVKFQPAMLEDALKLVNSNLFGSSLSYLIVTGLADLQTKIKEAKSQTLLVDGSDSIQLERLTENDIRSYINFHLQLINKRNEDLFSEGAIERIILYSKGLPGLINRLCNLGLLTANIEEKPLVTEDMMGEVLENSLFLGNEFDYSPPESTSPSPSSFQPEFNQTTIATTSTEQVVHPFLENIAAKNIINNGAAKNAEQAEQPKPSHHKPKVHRLKKTGVTPDNPNKSVFISAFLLGMVSAAAIGLGWYFFNQKPYKSYITTFDKQPQTESEKKEPQETFSIEDTTLPPENTKNTISNDTEGSVQNLLQLAEQQLENKKLMTPVEDSAWSTYKKILELNPNNQQALLGIYKIKETYTNWAKSEINKGNATRAISFLNNALEITPDDPEVLDTLLLIKDTQLANQTKNVVKIRNAYYKLLDEPNGVSKLLTIAKQQIAMKNLTKPESTSALSIYKLILARYPKHRGAIMGIKKIKDTYLLWAKNEIRLGDFPHAEYLYSKALEVAPSDPEALSDWYQLRKTTGKF